MTRLKLIALCATTALTRALSCETAQLDQVVADARAFEGTCVCITGVTEGDGINFALFRPPKPRESNRVILVLNTREPHYNPVDGHWVKVCGTVTPDQGRYFACHLKLESAEQLNKPPIPGRRVFGIFQNDGRETVQLELISSDRSVGVVMTLKPGDITQTVITEGKLKVFATSSDLSRTRLMAEHVMPTVQSAASNFDKPTRTFCFSVRGPELSLLDRTKAKQLLARWKSIKN